MSLGNVGVAVLVGAGIVGAVKLFSYLSAEYERMAADVWTVHEGEFDRIEYRVRHSESLRTRYGRHADFGWEQVKNDISVVFMTDGRSSILKGQIETPFARGTKVRIRQNGLGHRWLELA